MLPIFQKIAGMTDVDAICDTSLDIFESMPIHIHCKDLNGKYLRSNDRVWQDAGLNTSSDLLGKTDFDMTFLVANEAKGFRIIDEFVMKSRKTHFFTQVFTLANNKKYIALNHKTPLFSKQNEVLGVISFGVVIEQQESLFYDPNYPMLNFIFLSKVELAELLSNRQLACLYYVVAGLTNKEIGKKLGLSPKTVEHYIDTIKIKLDCSTRASLISYILTM